MGGFMQVCFLKHLGGASKNARAPFQKLGKQPQTHPKTPKWAKNWATNDGKQKWSV